MTGLLRKVLLEVRWPVVLFSLGLACIMALLTALLPKVLGEADEILGKLAFIRNILEGFIKQDTGAGITEKMMQAFLWVHPTVLALIWAHALMYCSRVPAGEIDRGSVDFLLGLPISRWRLYQAESIGFVMSGVVILSAGFGGHWMASSSLQPDMRPGAFATFSVMCNLFAVYLAVGGIAFLVSAFNDRRGRAIGIMFAILMVSFLINFVAQFWDPAKSIAFLSVMEYYRPAITINSGSFPKSDALILFSIATVAWISGGIVLNRRSICTV